MNFGFTEIQGLATVVLFGLVIWLVIEQKMLRGAIHQKAPKGADHSSLQLQAYERLTLFVERTRLKNLIMQMPSVGLSAREMQAGMIETIRAEFDHNITQQIYIHPEVWKAIINLKEQNIYILNQLGSVLPPVATSLDYSKTILQYLENHQSDLSSVVLDAIQFEVKKLI